MTSLGCLLSLGLVLSGASSAKEAAPAATGIDTPLKVLVLDLSAEEADRSVAKTIGELLAVSLSERPYLEVLTGADVRSALEMEASKEQLGCESSASCLAELAGAMGAQLVVHGNVGRLGDLYVVTINAFDPTSARSGGREQMQARDLAELAPEVSRAVRSLLRRSVPVSVRGAHEDEVAAPTPAASQGPFASPLFLGGAAVAAVGVLATAAGGVMAIGGNSVLASPSESSEAKQGARTLGVTGLVVALGGAVLVGGGAALSAPAFLE